MLRPHWVKSEAISIAMQVFKNKAWFWGANLYHLPPPFYKEPYFVRLYFMNSKKPISW